MIKLIRIFFKRIQFSLISFSKIETKPNRNSLNLVKKPMTINT
jgi:hypothetical protein